MATTQISVSDLAERLKITRQAVLKKIKYGKLPNGHTASMVGNQYVITINQKIK
ncbi:MAG: hypothetical protein ACK505_06170 [Flavobacteriales bacterium]|jgi:predicted transcriptional regulator